uniref:BTB domain-containing protein n=1 Tax=Panagrolaimus sp. ES5 TaxID=591445 RepID=A0AC34GN30_9BILA
MFDSGMKEARENKVKIAGFPYEVVEEAVRFCYDRDHLFAFDILSDDDKMLLLKFSDVYDMASLKTYIESEIEYTVTPDNVCRLANASIKFNAEKLHSRCINYLVKCIKDSTPVANFDILNAILKTELLNKVVCHKI